MAVKAHFSGAKRGRDLREALRLVSLSEATLDAIETQVEGREVDIAKALTCALPEGGEPQ